MCRFYRMYNFKGASCCSFEVKNNDNGDIEIYNDYNEKMTTIDSNNYEEFKNFVDCLLKDEFA